MSEWQPAPGEEASVALALANSRHPGPDGIVDHVSSPAQARQWLSERGLPVGPAAVREADVTRLSELRAAAREVLTALADERVPDPAAVTALNIRAAAVPGAVQLRWDAGDGPAREWRTVAPGTFEAALAAIAADTIEVAAGARGSMLRRCEAHGCVRVFLREHGRRRWCSTTCGDRVRAMRHYHRHRDES